MQKKIEKIEKELSIKENRKKIKERCAWCNAKLPKNKEAHYKIYGNCCKTCSGLFSKMCEGKKTKEGKKIRNYTQEEKNKMMEKRRKIVKLNKL